MAGCRRSGLVLFCLLGVLFGAAHAQPVYEASLGIGSCFPPAEPFPYKLEKSDPLYEAARAEHQAHLEGLEDYVNCLDRERGAAVGELRASFDLFLENFGKDAVLSYGEERRARP